MNGLMRAGSMALSLAAVVERLAQVVGPRAGGERVVNGRKVPAASTRPEKSPLRIAWVGTL